MNYFFLILTLMTFISCGKIEGIANSVSSISPKARPVEIEPFSYQLHGSSCTTGEHEFISFVSTCEALKDNELNQDCALEQRRDLFESSECTGDFSSL